MKHSPLRRLHQTGIALITAMLVMALAAIAAAAVLVSAQAAIHRSGNLIDSEKSWWYAEGLENWVRILLQRDKQGGAGIQANPYDALSEFWAKPIDYLPVEQGGLRGKLVDLQGRFNLNNFYTTGPNVDPMMLERFQLLFQHIKGLDASQAAPIAQSIKDWIDSDHNPTGAGGEDDDYANLKPPYHAADQLMKSPTELLALKGMTPEIYQLLAPYVATLPLPAPSGTPTPTAPAGTRRTLININTAPFPVLMSLAPGMDESKVNAWILDRQKNPTDDVQKKFADGTLASGAQGFVDMKTDYFLMVGEAFVGTGRVALYSVVMRPATGSPIVISRSLDTE